jgi:glycosyltransferase 2 family protein
MSSSALPNEPRAGSPAPAGRLPQDKNGWTKSSWWPWVTRGITLLFFAVVAYYTIRYARTVDWSEVWASIRGTPRNVLLGAAGLAAASHALYACFDLLGRRYTGHGLPVPRVMQVNFISYAFNLNLGSLVGGVAFRYRMYTGLGLDYPTITRVLTLSMLTNWLGYLVLAGLVFAIAPLQLPPDWKLNIHGLQYLGISLLLVAAFYLGLCATAKERSIHVRGHELMLPPPRMALLQLLMSCANWMLIGGIIFVLLQGRVDYPSVLSVLLIAAVAGVITHVPAGLGVLEAVFVTLLSHRVPETQLLGALLTYRALYYIGPLMVAALLYLLVEVRRRKDRLAK